jgi:hypothetical protein
MTEEQVVPVDQPESIVERIDRIILEKQPSIIEKIRNIRRSEGMTFRGMTKQEISRRFTVALAGDETYSQLRQKVCNVNTLRNEASGYLKDLEAEYSSINCYLDQFKTNLDQEMIISNLTSKRNDKISDKAREVLASKIYTIDNIGDHLAEISVEMGYWKSIMKDLDSAFDSIETSLQALASEHKYAVAENRSDATQRR